MDYNNITDIIKLIARRDNISYIEAENIVQECQDEIDEALMYGRFQEAEDILASYLGLEPDYLDAFLGY